MINQSVINDSPFHSLSSNEIAHYYGLKSPENLNLLNVRAYQQTKDYTCGPAAVMALMLFYGMLTEKDMTRETELRIAKEMGTSKEIGTSPQQISAFLEHSGCRVKSGVNGTIEMLHDNLKQGIPTLVEWIDWGSHWAVVTGYYSDGKNADQDAILLADPSANDGNFKSIHGIIRQKPNRFASMWFDAQYINPGQLVKGIYITASPR